MLGSYRVRTDLAVESKEKFEKDHVEIKGVAIHEKYQEELDLRTTLVRIETDHGSAGDGKAQRNVYHHGGAQSGSPG